MRILHILSQMPDFTGSGKTVQAILRQARARHHENLLVAGIQDGFEPDPGLSASARMRFVRFNGGDLDFPLPGMSNVMPYESTVFSEMTSGALGQYRQAFTERLEQVKADFNPDIVHSHHIWIVSAIARTVFRHVPMVTSCHGTCLRQSVLCPEIGAQITASAREIDRILCLSRHQRDQVRQVHKIPMEKLSVVGAGFDDRLFGFNPDTDAKKSSGPVEMVFAGKLSRAKGVLWLLRALEKKPRLNCRLHLAGSGSGPEMAECIERAETMGDRVVLHGALSHADLAGLMRRAHLFVLPSFFEGLPLVIMEALASGCRVLTTALPGTMEIIGRIDPDMVDLVELPELETVDSPFEQDLHGLEETLSQALEKAVGKILVKRQPDTACAGQITRACTWETVFSRMEAVYRQVSRGG